MTEYACGEMHSCCVRIVGLFYAFCAREDEGSNKKTDYEQTGA
jgi:hypothetical protein